MKQNTLFNYLKSTIKSDSKPAAPSEKKPPPDPKLKEVSTVPPPQKSQKVSAQEERDLKRAIDESLKDKDSLPLKDKDLRPSASSPSKPLRRLKKAADIKNENPTKLTPKLDESNKSKKSFLEPDPVPIKADEKEIQKVIDNLSKEELEFNFEKFRFSKGDTPQKNIETLFKQRKEKDKEKKDLKHEAEDNKPPVNKYLIDEEKDEEDHKTDVLTEELCSDPDEEFFNQLNRPKNQSSGKKATVLDKPKLPPPDQKKLEEQLKRATEQHKKPEIKPLPVASNKPSTQQPLKHSATSIHPEPKPAAPTQTQKKQATTPQKDKTPASNPSTGNKRPFWATKEKKSPNKNPIPMNENGPLKKLTFVITGLLDCCDREVLQDILKSEGAKVTSNVSGRTSYLIVGNKLEDGRPVESSSKYRKALEHKTKMLKEDELDDFLFQRVGKRINELVGIATQTSLGIPASPMTQSVANVQKGQSVGNVQKGPSTQNNFKNYLGAVYTAPKHSPSPNKTPNPQAVKSQPYTATELWTHKYAPQDLSQLVGNNDSIKKLADWLNSWNAVVLKGEKKSEKPKGGPGQSWSKMANINARAALISGPPGIGKTTSVRVLAKQLGYELIEKNASDIRNKSSINTLLGDLKSNVVLGHNGEQKKSLILMDEVDGMSSDRGGSVALIEIIKSTKMPIICIANDRQHPKMRTLANYCYDLRFHKPQKMYIARKMSEICAKEGLNIDTNTLELLCESLNNDLRQILNVLEMMKRRGNQVQFFDMKRQIGGMKKDDTVMLSNFDAATKLMNSNDAKKLDFREKLDLFFIDYDLIPLLVQENYLNACRPNMDLETLVKTSETIAFSDNIINSIRRNNDWGLMPNYGFTSCIYPTFLSSNMIPFPKFPEFLGKNSSQRKITREIRELRIAMGPVISGNRLAVKFDYSEALFSLLLENFMGNELELMLSIMEHYNLTPELYKENLTDTIFNPKKIDLFAGVPASSKSALTRIYNKQHKDSFRGKKGKKASPEETEMDGGLKDPLYEEAGKKEEIDEGEEMEEEKKEEESEGEKSETKEKKKTEKKGGKQTEGPKRGGKKTK